MTIMGWMLNPVGSVEKYNVAFDHGRLMSRSLIMEVTMTMAGTLATCDQTHGMK